MFHIRQRVSWDCGVAVAAMVTRVSYEEVAWLEDRGIHPGEMTRLLGELTRVEWREKTHMKRIPFSSIGKPAWCIPVVLENASACRHYVAIRGSVVFDPALPEPVPLRDYSGREARLCATFWPDDPDAVQNHASLKRIAVLAELSRELYLTGDVKMWTQPPREPRSRQ